MKQNTFPIFTKLGGRQGVLDILKAHGFTSPAATITNWIAKRQISSPTTILLMGEAEKRSVSFRVSDFVMR